MIKWRILKWRDYLALYVRALNVITSILVRERWDGEHQYMWPESREQSDSRRKLRALACRWPLEGEKGKETNSPPDHHHPGTTRRKHALLTLWPYSSKSNFKLINLCYFKPPRLWYFVVIAIGSLYTCYELQRWFPKCGAQTTQNPLGYFLKMQIPWHTAANNSYLLRIPRGGTRSVHFCKFSR